MRLRKRRNDHQETNHMDKTLDNLLDAKTAHAKTESATEGHAQKWTKLYLDAIKAASELGLCSIEIQTPPLGVRGDCEKQLRKLGFVISRDGEGSTTYVSWIRV